MSSNCERDRPDHRRLGRPRSGSRPRDGGRLRSRRVLGCARGAGQPTGHALLRMPASRLPRLALGSHHDAGRARQVRHRERGRAAAQPRLPARTGLGAVGRPAGGWRRRPGDAAAHP